MAGVIYDHEAPKLAEAFRRVMEAPEADVRRVLCLILDTLYGSGVGDESHPRCLDPDKEWADALSGIVDDLDCLDFAPCGDDADPVCGECDVYEPLCSCPKVPA